MDYMFPNEFSIVRNGRSILVTEGRATQSSMCTFFEPIFTRKVLCNAVCSNRILTTNSTDFLDLFTPAVIVVVTSVIALWLQEPGHGQPSWGVTQLTLILQGNAK